MYSLVKEDEFSVFKSVGLCHYLCIFDFINYFDNINTQICQEDKINEYRFLTVRD